MLCWRYASLIADPVSEFSFCFPRVRVRMRIKKRKIGYVYIFTGMRVIPWLDTEWYRWTCLAGRGRCSRRSEDASLHPVGLSRAPDFQYLLCSWSLGEAQERGLPGSGSCATGIAFFWAVRCPRGQGSHLKTIRQGGGDAKRQKKARSVERSQA